MQDHQEGRFNMQGLALTRLIHSIVREYGQYCDGSYSVYLSDIDNADRKLLLSHLSSPEEYEMAVSNSVFMTELWNENVHHIQSLIDHESSEVYREDMEEMGLSMKRHSNNNEPYWTRI